MRARCLGAVEYCRAKSPPTQKAKRSGSPFPVHDSKSRGFRVEGLRAWGLSRIDKASETICRA